MKKIFTLGEIVVEIMADKVGQQFTKNGIWHGPFPSGAPAIFIDQVAKLGGKSSIISSVGNDGFGQLNIERLQQDGVDTTNIAILENKTTGSAFVTYHVDGNRDFIFNIKDAACACLNADFVTEDILKDCAHFHVMGSSLFSNQITQAVTKAIEIVKNNKGTISFDPNIRKEILNSPEMKKSLMHILRLTDIYLPSESEVTLLSDSDNYEGAIEYYLANGIQSIVVKKGSKGASYHSSTESIHVTPHHVKEVDPTGAGDSFGGAYIALIQQGWSHKNALKYANACGAIAVTCQGPMEGTSTLEEIEQFLSQA